ncbi:MAG TPA: hypothetical protein VJV79_01860 [Polyangiaceae bacterium]|nr:hypothetical protein [Polyangiaceae bacterium]
MRHAIERKARLTPFGYLFEVRSFITEDQLAMVEKWQALGRRYSPLVRPANEAAPLTFFDLASPASL